MARHFKQGWYNILNISKFMPPSDKFMKSFNESTQSVNYKSSYELRAFKYADMHPSILKWSIEPFAIQYIKPTTQKVHRYYIDMYLEFKSGDKFLVEIKPFSETKPPRKPSKKTDKSILNYNRAIQTYLINQAKWKAATEFAQVNNMKFIILTEKDLF